MAVSTYCILWSLWLCKTERAPRGIAYWLPTDGDVRDFVRSKLEPIIRDNQELFEGSNESTEAANVGLKFFWKTPTFWRGLKSKSAVKSISADATVFDEFDECDPSQVTQARERMSASEAKFVRELSTPTIPDFGIDKRFQETDQCFIHFHCQSCGSWECLEDTFPECMLQNKDGSYYRGCTKCKKPLDLSKFEWVKKYPFAKARGYQISQLYSPWVDVDALMHEYYNTEFPGHFWNHKIGLPWVSAADRVTREQVLDLCDQFQDMKTISTESTVMGVDVGSIMHCVVLKPGKPDRIIWIGIARNFEELDTLILRFNAKAMVIDAMPEQHKVRELIKRNQRKVYACWYSDSQKDGYSWDDINHKVSVNRTESLDTGTQAVHAKTLVLPKRDHVVEEFATHCSNIVKSVETDDDTGDKKFVYRRTGPDHYRHALNYAKIAASKFASTAVSVWRK